MPLIRGLKERIMRAEKKDRAEADCRDEKLGRKQGGTRRRWCGRRCERKREREREKKEKGDFRREGGIVEGVEKSTRGVLFSWGLMR